MSKPSGPLKICGYKLNLNLEIAPTNIYCNQGFQDTECGKGARVILSCVGAADRTLYRSRSGRLPSLSDRLRCSSSDLGLNSAVSAVRPESGPMRHSRGELEHANLVDHCVQQHGAVWHTKSSCAEAPAVGRHSYYEPFLIRHGHLTSIPRRVHRAARLACTRSCGPALSLTQSLAPQLFAWCAPDAVVVACGSPTVTPLSLAFTCSLL